MRSYVDHGPSKIIEATVTVNDGSSQTTETDRWRLPTGRERARLLRSLGTRLEFVEAENREQREAFDRRFPDVEGKSSNDLEVHVDVEDPRDEALIECIVRLDRIEAETEEHRREHGYVL